MDLKLIIILGMTSFPVIIYLILGIRDCRNIKDIDDYFLAGRKISTLSCALNAVTANFSFVTAVFVLLTWSYQYGAAVWWTLITAVLGFVAYAIPRVSPIRDTGFFSEGNTIHEYLGLRYQSRIVRFAASIATITAFLGFFVAELYIFAFFLTQYINVNIWTLVFILAVINAIYTILGGYESVLSTDIWQIIFILFGLGCILFIFITGSPDLRGTLGSAFDLRGLIKAVPPFDSTPSLFVIMLLIINGLWQFSAMDMWQRSLATGNQKKIMKGSILGGVIFFLIAIPILLAGMGTRLKFTSSQLSPFDIIKKLLEGHSPIVIGGLICLFASASLASVETTLIALSQSVLYDVLGPFSKRKDKPSVSKARVTILFIIAGGLIFLYLFMKCVKFDLISFLMTFFSCQIVLLPAIFHAVRRPGAYFPHWPATVSISVGYLFSLVFGLTTMEKMELQAFTPVLGAVSAFVVFWVVLPFFREAEGG